jgi:FkbM family methyltransferase
MTTQIPFTAKCAKIILKALPLYNGKGRIIDRTPLGKIHFDAETLDTEALDGFKIRVFPNDLIGRQIVLTGCFDRSVIDVLVRLSQPRDCLWDIGANIGFISSTFLSRVENSKCVAVEPLPDVHALLSHNLLQFGAQRSKCLMAAVSDKPGFGNILRTHGNIGHSHLISEEATNANTTRVNLVDGEHLLSAFGPPNLLKIDVEGHETQVITGLGSVIKTSRPRAIVFETHGGWPEGELASVFASHNYKILCIAKNYRGWAIVPQNAGLPFATEFSNDFIATPESNYNQLVGLSYRC